MIYFANVCISGNSTGHGKATTIVSLDIRHRAKPEKLSFTETNNLFNKYQIYFIEILSEASLEMDQSDLQLYSLDKDLGDSRHKAKQNLDDNRPMTYCELGGFQPWVEVLALASFEKQKIAKISRALRTVIFLLN